MGLSAETHRTEVASGAAPRRAAPAREDARDWISHAACAGRDPERWFNAGSRLRRIALAICSGCAVARGCRELGQEIGASGIWGFRLLGG